MSRSFLFLVLTIAVPVIWSCTSIGAKKQHSVSSYLQPARGEANAILVVMDTARWNGPIGDALRSVYSDYVPGLPQDEPYFKIRNINPLKLNTILKSAKNMIFLSTLNNPSYQNQKMMEFFTSESLELIKADSSKFRFSHKNEWAQGQEILHLFGQSEEQLITHLKNNKASLKNYFLQIENKRLAKSIFKVREKGIEKKMANEYNFKFSIPYGYDLSKSLPDFVWVRFLDPEFEKNIFVHFKPYDSKQPFEDVLAFRESITSTYMRDVEKSEIYMTLQGDGEQYQHISEVNFHGKYAIESRGLWMLSDISNGGPYLSYLFVDESQKRMYYLEGYVYAPGEDKRVFMQEIEVILDTFVSGKELRPVL